MRVLGGPRNQVFNLRGYGAGLAVWDRDAEGQGNFRFGLDWMRRSCHTHLYSEVDGSYNLSELDLATDLVYFYSEAQIALAKGEAVYFDFGPMIGMQVHQRRRGMRYATDPYLSDPTPVDESETRFGIRDLRLRLGLSGDIKVGSRIRIMLKAAISCGWGNWAEEIPMFTLDEEVGVGMAWQLTKSAQRR